MRGGRRYTRDVDELTPDEGRRALADEHGVVSKADVAEMLGIALGSVTVHVQNGRIPAPRYFLGGWGWSLDEIEQFAASDAGALLRATARPGAHERPNRRREGP